jgi:hypothetical protein
MIVEVVVKHVVAEGSNDSHLRKKIEFKIHKRGIVADFGVIVGQYTVDALITYILSGKRIFFDVDIVGLVPGGAEIQTGSSY